MKYSIFLLSLLLAAQAPAQSKRELKAQLTRLETGLAESRKYTSNLSDRLATLEAQQEAVQRLRRDLEKAIAERDVLSRRLYEMEKQAQVLRQGQHELEQKQQALLASPNPYNAPPRLASQSAETNESVEANDSLSYLNEETAPESPGKKPVQVRKTVRKKPAPLSRKKKRRRR
ncbi:MAG: hypothetical protein LH606_10175 [Cytophagaceae bacterium]|nr:hypothetical protein [Cytophagaceae bacterium]